MDLSKYKSLFISESLEHLDAMTQNLLDLEKGAARSESIEELFRHAHSIKGMAAAMGYSPIESLSHRLEDLMDDIREGRLETTSDTIDILLEGRDVLEKFIKEVDGSDDPAFEGADEAIYTVESYRKAHGGKTPSKPPPPLPTKKTEAAEDDFGGFDGEVVGGFDVEQDAKHSSLEGMVPEWPEEHRKTTEKGEAAQWDIKAKMKDDIQAPSARAFLVLKRIGKLGEVESDPSVEDIRKGKFEGELSIRLTTDANMSKITDLLSGISELQQYQVEPVELTPRPEAERVPSAGETAPVYELPQTVKVETRDLDRFVNMVGELLTVKTGLRDMAKKLDQPELNSRLDRLETLIHDLHSQVMDVRMIPLESITARFPRAVRDLAKQANKEIDFKLKGQDVELDRAILEKMVDPLIHLLRNSVDHGIEAPDQREKLRKPRSGTLTLSAYREKDLVAIEVADDGKGIDVEAIKESAIGKGLIDAEQAELMSYDEALMLICEPGFSTAEEVTFISGRGVGMNVVKSTIENLGGILQLKTELGKGTRTILLLPRTVAIMNVLLVSTNLQVFAVPIAKLVRTVEFTSDDFQMSQRGKMVLFENEPIPVHDLAELLSLKSTTSGNDRRVFPALVVEHGHRHFAILVDEYMGQEEAFIRPLGRPLNRVDGLAGVMTRGDGKPVFVLDVGNLI